MIFTQLEFNTNDYVLCKLMTNKGHILWIPLQRKPYYEAWKCFDNGMCCKDIQPYNQSTKKGDKEVDWKEDDDLPERRNGYYVSPYGKMETKRLTEMDDDNWSGERPEVVSSSCSR